MASSLKQLVSIILVSPTLTSHGMQSFNLALRMLFVILLAEQKSRSATAIHSSASMGERRCWHATHSRVSVTFVVISQGSERRRSETRRLKSEVSRTRRHCPVTLLDLIMLIDLIEEEGLVSLDLANHYRQAAECCRATK